MSGRGRHRRHANRRISRRLSRTSLVITAGGAGIALPFLGTGTAQAASVDTWDKVAQAGLSRDSAAPDLSADSRDSGKHAKPRAANSPKKDGGSKSDERYTVKPGDNLSAIARAHDVKGGWHTLYDANRKTVGSDPDLIHPGQRLTLSGDAQGKAAEPQGGKSPGAGATPSSGHKYGNNLDGWIREALDVMRAKNIPGTYHGIRRNIMRESGGNPNAVNNWDINAQNGTPSKGLLQTIQPTFDAYHVQGTPHNITDPVANIVAACNYAADRYGSMDNVNSAY